MSKLLVVDDEESIRSIATQALSPPHEVATAEDPASALIQLREEPCDVLLSDVRMPGGGGKALVEQALRDFPDLAVIIVSGTGDVEDLAAFLRLGVVDYVLKPFTLIELHRAVTRALAVQRLRADNRRLREASPIDCSSESLLGTSSAMEAVREVIARAAPTDATVLVTGSSGTGKELVARALHGASTRAAGPFVAVHAGAMPPQLLESELFGHVRGAFTGADHARVGRFEEAEGGTLFLDEIGTMGEDVQVRLLRALGSREITRVGEDRPRKVDVRVVAATNANLQEMIAQGRFREDLFYRLNVVPLRLPDLRERDGDVEILAPHFLDDCCSRIGVAPKTLSPVALRKLAAHTWPGNVRELENAIERAVILAGTHATVEEDDVLLDRAGTPADGRWKLPDSGLDLPALLASVETATIEKALRRTGNNKQQAANLLGLQRTTLIQKLRRREAGAAATAHEETAPAVDPGNLLNTSETARGLGRDAGVS